MTPNRRNRGFTLIELMIVVVIIGILAAIAYPSYRSYILKGNRASAQAFLMDAAQRQQQYFLDNRAYAPDLGALFGTATAALAVPSEVSPYYGVPIVATSAGPPPTFVITATPQGAQATNNEPTLTIDQAGTRTPSTSW
ncbi:MAG: type IV pilin protein [Pseudomonadota bacterium]